jgi:hypothetical protein
MVALTTPVSPSFETGDHQHWMLTSALPFCWHKVLCKGRALTRSKEKDGLTEAGARKTHKDTDNFFLSR